MTDAPLDREPQRVMHAMEGLELPTPGMGAHVIVGPKCDADDGQWMCIAHRLIMANQLQLESHIDDDETHLLVWHCHMHGPETP